MTGIDGDVSHLPQYNSTAVLHQILRLTRQKMERTEGPSLHHHVYDDVCIPVRLQTLHLFLSNT